MRNIKIGVILAVMAVIVIHNACKSPGKQSTPQAASGDQQPLPVQAILAEGHDLKADVRVPGTILAFESTEIHPEVSGRIVELNIREGGNVSKGDLLAKLYDGDLQAQLRKYEVQLKIAEQTEQRQAELLKIQGISQQDYDASLLQVQTLKADMDIVQEDIRKTEIRAPFDGKLGLKQVSPGAFVSPTTVLTTIGEVNRLKVQFDVPERYSSEVKSGMEVSFNIDGSDKDFHASIIATAVEVSEATRSLAVRAEVKEHDPALRPGVFAQVEIILGKKENALMIPNLVITLQGRKKQIFVYKGGKAIQTDIETGVRDSMNIEVINGLRPGDTVITSSLLFLRPGMPVTVTKIDSL